MLTKSSCFLLLARGRDRLETKRCRPFYKLLEFLLLARGRDRLETSGDRPDSRMACLLSYSLGDAIDWKHLFLSSPSASSFLLLARGRDRLETVEKYQICYPTNVSYSLGDAIDWKLQI